MGTSISQSRAHRIPAELADRLRAVAARTMDAGPVNLSAVAADIGVPRSTLYYYFRGAEELTRWLVEELLVQLGHQVTAAVAAQHDPPAQLVAAISTVMDVTVQQRGLTEALLSAVFSGPDVADRLRMTRESVFPAVRETLERGIADGSLVDVDVDETIAGFIGALGVIGLHHMGGLGPADPEPPPNDFISLMLRGLQAPVGGPAEERVAAARGASSGPRRRSPSAVAGRSRRRSSG